MRLFDPHLPTPAQDSYLMALVRVLGRLFRDIVKDHDILVDHLGEYVESTLASGSATSLTTNTAKTITSIVVPIGDWELSGMVIFNPAASTTVDDLHMSISTTTNTHDTTVGRYAHMTTNLGPNAHEVSLQVSTIRVSLTAETTYYLVGEATFAASTCTAYGRIYARRLR